MNHLAWLVIGFALGLVTGMALQVAMLAAPANAEDTIRHIHSSSRYDRSTSSLHQQAVRFRDRDVVTWTEVGGRTRALRGVGQRVWAPPGQLAISTTWRIVAKGDYAPTRLVYHSTRGNVMRTRSVWVVIQRDGVRVLVTLSHLPAHVEFGDHWRSCCPQRVRVWKAAVRGWAAQTRQQVKRFTPDLVIVTGDWNVDVKRPVWRRVVTERFPRLHLTWKRPFPGGGTHGHRLIDATLTNGQGRARLLADDRSSDHRPFGELLAP